MTVRDIYLTLAVVVIFVVITQYDRMRSDSLPSLPGTRWYNGHFDEGAGYSNGLGYEFVDDEKVELVDGDGSVTELPYTIHGNRIVIKHPKKTVKLVRRGRDLIEWVGLGPLARPVHFRPVKLLKKPKLVPYI